MRSRANIGPSKTHLDYQNVGCTQKDFQNCLGDLKTLIKDSNAYVFFDNLKRKQEADFSF